MKTLLTQIKTLTLIILAVFGLSNSYSQAIVIPEPGIPETFFGINYWYYEEINPPPYAAGLSTSDYKDHFDDKLISLEAGGIKMVRIGGSKYNKDWITPDYWPLYERAINNVRSMNAKPILQLPINLIELDQNGVPTPASIAIVQDWVLHFNATGINPNNPILAIHYWAIGNEPDHSDPDSLADWHNPNYYTSLITKENGNTYPDFVTKFKAIATIIKEIAPNDIVVGPDFRHFYGGTNETNTPLADDFYFDDFINDVGIAIANGVPILDIFTFHYYGYNITSDKGRDFEIVKGYIDEANTNRAESPLSFAMGEVNANPNETDSAKPKPWDFAAGQFLAFCAKYIMKYSGEFICPWSVYEDNGDKETNLDAEGKSTDYSLYDENTTEDGPGLPRSTMWHFAALAQNRRDYYMESNVKYKTDDIRDNIHVVGMTDQNGSTVMIMNTGSTQYTYSIRLKYNAFSNDQVYVKIKVQPKIPIIQGDPNLVHTGTIDGNETIVYVFDAAGNVFDPIGNVFNPAPTLPSYEYTDGGTLPVLVPPLRVASVNANPSTSIVGKEEVNLYPVPTLDNLNVDNATNYKSIQIYNNVGQLVHTASNPNQSKFKIDLSGLAPGMYHIHLKGDSKTVIKKIIKNSD